MPPHSGPAASGNPTADRGRNAFTGSRCWYMGQDSIPFAAISTDPQISPELARPLVAALEGMHGDAILDMAGMGRDQARRWLLPTAVTVQFRPCFLTLRLLQELQLGVDRPVTAALVTVYTAVDAVRRSALVPAGLRPVSLEFRGSPQESFRFVLGVGLHARDVAHALEELPATLQQAGQRLRRNEDVLDSLALRYAESVAEEHSSELVYLYEGPIYGWQIIT